MEDMQNLMDHEPLMFQCSVCGNLGNSIDMAVIDGQIVCTYGCCDAEPASLEELLNIAEPQFA